jgi:putative acetyltransferase
VSPAIREQAPADRDSVRALLVAAFPTPLEADLVERLHADGDTMLALVAEQGGEVAGVAVFSRMTAAIGGRAIETVGLAPVATAEAFRRRGIADALVREGLARLADRGVRLVFVLGDPAYYRRFGFDPALADGFASPYAGPYLMARALGVMPEGRRGTAEYAPAFAAFEEPE